MDQASVEATPPKAVRRKKTEEGGHHESSTLPATSSSPPAISSQSDPTNPSTTTNHTSSTSHSSGTPSSPSTRKVKVKREKSVPKSNKENKSSSTHSTTADVAAPSSSTPTIPSTPPISTTPIILTAPILLDKDKTPDVLRREKRMKLVNEFMSSELGHVEALKTVVIDYVQPLRRLLPKETIKKLFGNIEVIMGWNIQFYGRLRARYEESEDVSVDSNCDEHEFLFGDIMVEMLVILRQLYSQYNENYEESQITYRECMKNKDFEQFILNPSTQNPKFSLLTLLYLPLGRMIIYDSLLKEIIQITPPGHPDREDLSNAQKMIGAATRQAGRVVEMRKNLHNVLRIQSLLQNASEIAEPHRRYVYEGAVVFEAGPKNFKEREMFLFNDMLIIAKPKRKKFEVEWSYKLTEIQLIDNDEDDRSRFKIKDATGNELSLASEEKQTWMYHIKASIKNLGATPQELHALRIEEDHVEDSDAPLKATDAENFHDSKYLVDLILKWSEMKSEDVLLDLQSTAQQLRKFVQQEKK